MPIFRVTPEMMLSMGEVASVKEHDLPVGVLGNLETIEVMKKLAHKYKGHPKVRQLALNILLYDRIASNNYVHEALAIGRFVQAKVRYVKDTLGIEQVHDPLYMIKKIQEGTSQGDCDDMAMLIATFLLSIGHRPSFRAVRYRSTSGPYNHIYVVVYTKNWGDKKNRRIVLDAILKRHEMGTEVPHTSGKEFKL